MKVAGYSIPPGSKVFWVDGTNGSDTNNGLSSRRAKATIEAAADLGVTDRDDFVFIMPGLYNEDLIVRNACHLIGLGEPGTDRGVRVRVTAGTEPAVKSMISGVWLENIRFEAQNIAYPCAYFLTLINGYIENCQFRGWDGDPDKSTYGIHLANLTEGSTVNCHIKNCQISNVNKGIGIGGGNNIFFNESIIEGCKIHSQSHGIEIEADCTVNASYIVDNDIIVDVAGNGILVTPAGSFMVANNRVITASGTPIVLTGSAKNAVGNHVFEGDQAVPVDPFPAIA